MICMADQYWLSACHVRVNPFDSGQDCHPYLSVEKVGFEESYFLSLDKKRDETTIFAC